MSNAYNEVNIPHHFTEDPRRNFLQFQRLPFTAFGKENCFDGQIFHFSGRKHALKKAHTRGNRFLMKSLLKAFIWINDPASSTKHRHRLTWVDLLSRIAA